MLCVAPMVRHYHSNSTQHISKIYGCGTGIPVHGVEALARVLLPEIQAFFESEEGQREYAEWKAKNEKPKEN